jgi:hypothetical protein
VVIPHIRRRWPRGCVDFDDAADGADGMFGSSTHPDDPVSSSAFTAERNVDAEYPQERLRATQAANQRGFFQTGSDSEPSVLSSAGAEELGQQFALKAHEAAVELAESDTSMTAANGLGDSS